MQASRLGFTAADIGAWWVVRSGWPGRPEGASYVGGPGFLCLFAACVRTGRADRLQTEWLNDCVFHLRGGGKETGGTA